MESIIERTMYAARWLLAPVYLGLSAAIALLMVKFYLEIIHVIPMIVTMKEADLILVVLSLVDMALVGGLLIMVMLSGYENFVSKLDVDENSEKLDWLGTMDSGSLKNKVAAAIVAISSIHLLKIFMEAGSYEIATLYAYVVIHITFVIKIM